MVVGFEKGQEVRECGCVMTDVLFIRMLKFFGMTVGFGEDEDRDQVLSFQMNIGVCFYGDEGDEK